MTTQPCLTASEALTSKKNNFFKNCDIVLHSNTLSPKSKSKKPTKEPKSSKSERSRSLTKHKKRDKSNKSHKSPKKSHKSPKKKLKSEDHTKSRDQSESIKKSVDMIKSNPQSQSLPCSPVKPLQNAPLRFKNKSKLLDSTMRRNMCLSSLENPHKKLKPKETDSAHSRTPQLELTKEEADLFDSIIKSEHDANGGSTFLITYQSDLDAKLHIPGKSHQELLSKFAVYFLGRVYAESKEDDEETPFKDNDDG